MTHSPPARSRPAFDYDEHDSPEHATWKNHRDLILRVPREAAAHRGCFGLALVVDATTTESWVDRLDRKFVPDSTLRWASVVDIPYGHFREPNTMPEVHWATVRPTTVRFGVPMLARDVPAGCAWDFRAFPFDHGRLVDRAGKAYHVDAKPDVFSPSANPQLFKIFNAIEWAMTSTAFHFRHDWKVRRQEYYRALRMPYRPTTQAFLFGESVYDGIAHPSVWMPKPYLAFERSTLDLLFDRSTKKAIGDRHPAVYRPALLEAFVEAAGDYLGYRVPFAGRVAAARQLTYRGFKCVEFKLHGNRGERAKVRFAADAVVQKAVEATFEAGDTIAEETFAHKLPANWHDKKWEHRLQVGVDRLFPGRLDEYLRLWFDRQAVDLGDGLLHYSADLASPAALGSAVDAKLVWDVSEALEYYRADCDACVFPTIGLGAWDALVGNLPGEVAYDLTPVDGRFVAPVDRNED